MFFYVLLKPENLFKFSGFSKSEKSRFFQIWVSLLLVLFLNNRIKFKMLKHFVSMIKENLKKGFIKIDSIICLNNVLLKIC